jgi:hypothetical protein
MQFGVGLLGAGWTPEFAREKVCLNADPARKNFHLHATCYAAKVAAETILAEPPSIPDLSDAALLYQLGTCAPAPRPSEVHMVREAFLAEYGNRSTRPEQERHAETGRRLEELKNGIANLHDRYAAPPSAPRCCPDCAANDLPNELRLLLRDAQ